MNTQKQPIIVQKFGGSSVANAERIRAVARRIVAAREAGYQVVVVVSAQGDTTDHLISMAREISAQPPRREMDMLLATGEQISIALVAMAIDALGHKAISLTGAQGGILTDATHTKARIRRVDTERLRRELRAGRIVIVAGFQGIALEKDDITTLGRGGSDTTAVALAVALQAEICEIYTDVDGVYTADPRIVPDARRLNVITYAEMLELASLGAAVLQPRSVEIAAEYGVPVRVRSSFTENPGTIVMEAGKMAKDATLKLAGNDYLEKEVVVTGVAHDVNCAKVVILGVPDRPGVAFSIFSALAAESINVDMIVQTTRDENATDLLFTVSEDDLPRTIAIAEEKSRELGAKGVLADSNVAKVSIVGAGMVSNPGVAARMFGALAGRGINIQVISTSEIKVSCLIERAAAVEAVQAIHRAFGLGEQSAPADEPVVPSA